MRSVSGAEVEEEGVVGVVGDIVGFGGVRNEQHPVGRCGGGEHPTSGVVDDERLRAALRGVLGVVPNSGALEDGVEFLTWRMSGFRCPRRSTWV